MSSPAKLTDTQRAILFEASQRKDRCLIPPKTLKAAAAQKVATKLLKAGLVREIKAKTGMETWRRDEETGQAYSLKLTDAGLKAIAADERGSQSIPSTAVPQNTNEDFVECEDFPVVLEDFHIRRGSGGKGWWHAGDGTLRRIRFLKPMHVAISAAIASSRTPARWAESPANSAATRSAAKTDASRFCRGARRPRSRRARRSRSSRRRGEGGGRRRQCVVERRNEDLVAQVIQNEG